ncbi:MAG: hypothetical protein A3B91_02165 [Candidatus Yanofskybacteria bacterium RIFCSPHIGHO2_02_FULL_41_29]|uniref:Uncharacterized protein n=1 Tax=Candidatus Yanofskybacteria bacterium RIFCSPHIGHO2_01_FULL_41_53 TaxID=1802663 RepID=A0A1F8EHE7_9BACT|nr:MAG: hypothetical protein A2650_04960 [Candidatus Yanofskybacteria bacterium RIFCSPHIGHO2_01_FULL_41_53]OGN12331.1 MAG: hypothetical protein A3B91_02165 [Candidatus Yanofskybacteria bacterium RIFCSPHIGHO2_02_FULL_41_29]OGN17710.1 MAG: hypothetical protein A3F48_00530 [Candidatus Yanofskybacteria bacterium RIFCSPHIGHO2_12_FULL_41_9]OGN22016.1 MAG: hypothetical protein A2916_04300 [Candidatus Yanofskybacteria bacterium RIFCSPLOWO2_01_FULL_41_67]OGN28906.1 MAG: hypothetical protein A3H54_02060 
MKNRGCNAAADNGGFFLPKKLFQLLADLNIYALPVNIDLSGYGMYNYISILVGGDLCQKIRKKLLALIHS